MVRNIRHIIKTGLTLEGCPTHKKGCYIRFKEAVVTETRPRCDCIVDYDKDGEVIGIEFYDGL